MLEVKGQFNSAKIFTDNIESEAISQIIELCNQEFVQGSKIRIMPDTHAGAGCVIGTTMTIKNKVVPNLVGVDIGCGMEVAQVGLGVKERMFFLERLDEMIHKHVPSGQHVRSSSGKLPEHTMTNIQNLKCIKEVDIKRAECSIGTLGGGNHFIEMNEDDEGYWYLVVHSGSRNIGKQVAEYYQMLGYDALTNENVAQQIRDLVKELKSVGRHHDIQKELKNIKREKIDKKLAYVDGVNFSNYIHDMDIMQHYAYVNRKAIMDTLIKKVGFVVSDRFTTVHNYIDTTKMILRKGAISAYFGEKVIIPMNMRDGSLICTGKGNSDWNYSAPHGAGRLMSRSKAKATISMDEYKESMQNVYTSSVNQSTLDEAPMAYKPMDEIIENIKDTVEIVSQIKPIYNFKAGE